MMDGTSVVADTLLLSFIATLVVSIIGTSARVVKTPPFAFLCFLGSPRRRRTFGIPSPSYLDPFKNAMLESVTPERSLTLNLCVLLPDPTEVAA